MDILNFSFFVMQFSLKMIYFVLEVLKTPLMLFFRFLLLIFIFATFFGFFLLFFLRLDFSDIPYLFDQVKQYLFVLFIKTIIMSYFFAQFRFNL